MTLTNLETHGARLEDARAILLQLSGQARRAREAFLDSVSPENVHALRGALRRVAAGVGLLQGFLPAPDAAWLRRELRWQARRLGKARDLDVLSARLATRHPYVGEFRPADLLIARARTKRDAAVETAKADILSARASILAERLEQVLLRALEASEGRLAFGDVTARWLSQADFAIRIGEKRVMKLGRRGRHKLRGDVRALRYNSEICSNGSPAEIQYIATLVALQTALGELNDDAVCAVLGQRLIHCGDLDKVPGLEPNLSRTHRRELKRAWRAFDASPLPDFGQGAKVKRVEAGVAMGVGTA